MATTTRQPDTVTDDPEGRAHIIESSDGGASQIVRDAIRDGTTVSALCGHTWTPKLMPQAHDLPVCRPCVKAAEARYG